MIISHLIITNTLSQSFMVILLDIINQKLNFFLCLLLSPHFCSLITLYSFHILLQLRYLRNTPLIPSQTLLTFSLGLNNSLISLCLLITLAHLFTNRFEPFQKCAMFSNQSFEYKILLLNRITVSPQPCHESKVNCHLFLKMLL